MDKKLALLIIDGERKYGNEIAEEAKNHPAFDTVDFAIDGVEGYELMKIIRPDVIIIDFLVSGLDAIGFLRKIKNETGVKKPYVVISSYTMLTNMINTAAALGADYFIMKPQPPEEICETIVAAVTTEVPKYEPVMESDDTDAKITQFIHCMGVPAHLDGHRYIRSALKIAMDDITMISPITKRLYPNLAKMYKKTPCCIERSIRHAISVSWRRGNQKLIRDVFGYSAESSMGCPTNAEYIAMLADDLRLRIKHDMVMN